MTQHHSRPHDFVTMPSSTAEVLRTSQLRTRGRRPKIAYDETEVLRRLEKEYDIGEWRSWRRTRSGTSNDSWFLATSSGSFVVRRSHDLKTPEGLRFEQALIGHLAAHGYPAPPLVPSRGGALHVSLDGVLHMITRRLPGTPYTWGPPDRLPTVARGLGWFHRLVHDLPRDQTALDSSSQQLLSESARARLESAGQLMEPLLPTEQRASLHGRIAWLQEATARTHGALLELLPQLTYTITHGSYGPTAVLLDEDRLTGVVDFDRAAHDLLVFDLATAVWVLGSATPARRDVVGLDAGRVSAILRAYRAEHVLRPADLQALAPALRARRLVTVAKKAENFVAKLGLGPSATVQAQKLARVLTTQAMQCRWLEENVPDLGSLAGGLP